MEEATRLISKVEARKAKQEEMKEAARLEAEDAKIVSKVRALAEEVDRLKEEAVSISKPRETFEVSNPRKDYEYDTNEDENVLDCF